MPPFTVTDGTVTVMQPPTQSFTEEAGTYTLTATDANGCTVSRTGVITQPDPLVVGTMQTNVSTAGGSDGSATAAPTGGTAPYS